MGKTEIRLTEEQVQGLQWEVCELTPDYRVSRAVYGQGPEGAVYAYKREIFAPEQFLDDLAQERNDTDNTGWGDDKNGIPLVKIGSVPLNVWYRDFANGRAQDKDYKKWWWAQDANQVFRTKRGRL